MRPRTTIGRGALLLLCTAVFAGTAFAGDKPKDDAPGSSANAPGQQKKADDQQAAAKAPPGQAKQAEKQAAKADKKEQKAEQKSAKRSAKAAAKQEKQSGSFKATSSGTDLKRGLDHKHTICHATGSDSNPFVVITPSISGVFNGHMGHQGGEDIIPPFTYKGASHSQNWDAEGQALFANGCEAAVVAATTTTATTTTSTTTTTEECPPTTRTITETVEGGVMHKTGSAKNPFVFIRPAKNSAHYTKHADDIVVEDGTVTRTIVVAADCEVTTTTQGGGTTTVTTAGETATVAGTTATVTGETVTTAAGETTTTTAAAGGVLGAQSPPGAGAPAGEEAGGVLGAVASLGETAVTGTLPFTGIPLWIAALIGGGLLAAGVALRRTT